MTRSKLDLATILVKLKGSDEDPVQVAKEMSLMKLCYEIQKVEEEREEREEREATASAPGATASAPGATASAPVETEESIPEELTKDEQKVVEELKVPVETSKAKRNKHILSWLVDSSSDDESS